MNEVELSAEYEQLYEALKAAFEAAALVKEVKICQALAPLLDSIDALRKKALWGM